jgi:Na+/serine symporter
MVVQGLNGSASSAISPEMQAVTDSVKKIVLRFQDIGFPFVYVEELRTNDTSTVSYVLLLLMLLGCPLFGATNEEPVIKCLCHVMNYKWKRN